MIETLPAPLRRAVSPYTGIVRALDECLHATTEPPLFQATCDIGRGRALGSALDHLTGVGGAGRTRGEAAAAAVGEALERYSGSFVPTDRLVVASARELGDAAVDPARFALFSPRQHDCAGFPFRPFTARSRVAWVEGHSLPDGRPAWLPAALVFLADLGEEGGDRIGYATSSGMACSRSVGDALVRSLCEVLERDAFMIVWANRLSLPRLDWSRDDQLSALDRTLFAPTGLAYTAIDLSPFHRLPSVLAVVRAPVGHPGALGVGAGTAPDLERAWWKALAEAFASRSAGAKLRLVHGGGAPARDEVLSFDDHIRYHADAGRSRATRFLTAGVASVDATAVPRLEGTSARHHVAALCRRVEAAGSSAYAVDITAPDVRELGLSVVKVVAPELCMLDVPHSARFLGGRRLYEAAFTLGLRARSLREREINPDPHPFP